MALHSILSSSRWALPLALLLGSCDDTPKQAEPKLSADECGHLFDLKRAIVREMCTPWDVARPTALSELAVIAKEYPYHYGEDDAAHNTEIGEIVEYLAREIGPEDCIKAGYPNPGPLTYNPVYLDDHPHSPLERKLNNIPKPDFLRKIEEQERVRALKRNGLSFSVFKGGDADKLPAECSFLNDAYNSDNSK